MIIRKTGSICIPFFLFVSLCLPPLSLSASQVVITSQDQFSFAVQYMEKEEYHKAIIEFERFIYFFPNDPLVMKADYFIGLCHLMAQEYESARTILSKVIGENGDRPLALKSLFLIGESYYRQGIPQEGERIFRVIIERYAHSPYQDLAYYRLGWIFLREGKWREASEIFQKVSRQNPLFDSSLTLSQESLSGESLRRKDPETAGILAGVLPGLGHVYCGRPRNGLVSFLLNGVFVWATIEAFDKDQEVLGSVLGLLEFGWYTGNIYSAVNCAHKHNRAQKNDFLKKLRDDLNLKLFFSKDVQAGLSLSFSF